MYNIVHMRNMDKLSKFFATISSKLKKKQVVQCELTAEEREEKIMYLVNLFRLTFRTDYAYAEAIREDKEIKPEEYYDESLMLDYYSYARCGSDEEMEEYRAKFKALGAEEKFLECCLDYYKDVNVELKISRRKLESKLKIVAIEQAKVLFFDKKAKHRYRNRRRVLEPKLEITMAKLAEVRQKINELRKSLMKLRANQKQNEMIK